jgi:hypothetical protein
MRVDLFFCRFLREQLGGTPPRRRMAAIVPVFALDPALYSRLALTPDGPGGAVGAPLSVAAFWKPKKSLTTKAQKKIDVGGRSSVRAAKTRS